MATTNKANDEFISIDEVTVSPRGRKKIIDAELAEVLGKVTAGKAVVLRGKFGNVAADKRPAVSQTIRKHWAHVRSDQCRIDYTPEGVPQVRMKATA